MKWLSLQEQVRWEGRNSRVCGEVGMTWTAGGPTDRSDKPNNDVKIQKQCSDSSTAGWDSLKAANWTHSSKSDHVPSSSPPSISKRHGYVLCMPREHLMMSIGRDTCKVKKKWSVGSKYKMRSVYSPGRDPHLTVSSNELDKVEEMQDMLKQS